MCSEPGFGASVSSSVTTTGAGPPSRPRLWAARRWRRLRPLPHPLRFCAGTATSSQPKYDGSKNRSPGRPPTAKDIRELIVRVARENPTWGYTRLRGALKNLGHELGRNTIKRLLAEHGIAPAPERGKSMSWSTFLKAHWGAIAATDLFTVEVVNPFGLVRYHVLFVIDIATRCVCIGGMTSDPNGEWMKQVARNLTDMWDGFLLGKRYLIHDRDPLFTEAVRGLLRDSGVKPLRLPANSPNLNAYAERFVLSIRRECLDRFVPLNERHLRTAITEYVVHYHTERNHQGLGNELLTPLPASANDAGRLVKILERPAGQQFAPFRGLLESGIAVGHVFLPGAQFVACSSPRQPI